VTVVNLRGLHTALGVPAVTSGVVMVEYWAESGPVARVDGADVVFPALITAAIVDGDPGTLDLVPTRGVCCVKWTVQSDRSAVSVVRFTEIPETGPVVFGTLQQVDPTTFVPTGQVVAAWEAVVADVDALRADAATSAGQASVSAQAAQDAAAPVTAAAATINAGLNVTDGAFAAVLDDPASESTTRLLANIAESIADAQFSYVDNGDGTITLNTGPYVDNGDGTITIGLA